MTCNFFASSTSSASMGNGGMMNGNLMSMGTMG